MYDHRNVQIYEKISAKLLDTGDSNKFLLMTKAGARLVGPVRRKTGPERLAVSTADGEILLEEREIAWLARWKQTIPRRSM